MIRLKKVNAYALAFLIIQWIKKKGRFFYPTTNRYNFFLLDQYTAERADTIEHKRKKIEKYSVYIKL